MKKKKIKNTKCPSKNFITIKIRKMKFHFNIYKKSIIFIMSTFEVTNIIGVSEHKGKKFVDVDSSEESDAFITNIIGVSGHTHPEKKSIDYKPVVIGSFAKSGKTIKQEDFLFKDCPYIEQPVEDKLRHNQFYDGDVFSLLLEKEKHINKVGDIQGMDVNETMIRVLAGWFQLLMKKWTIEEETYHLCMYILRTFLSKRLVGRNKLQLVGVASFMIAAKIEEIYPPTVDDYTWISAHAITESELLKIESIILNELGFDVKAPSSLEFFYFFRDFLFLKEKKEYVFLKGVKNPEKLYEKISANGKYLLRLTTFHKKYFSMLPSEIAIACLFLTSKKFIGEEFGKIWHLFIDTFSEKYNYEPPSDKGIDFLIDAQENRNKKVGVKDLRKAYRDNKYVDVDVNFFIE